MITADETHSNLISLPHHHTISYHNNIERPKLGSQNEKSGLRAMPEGTEKESKERQGQNWPGKHFFT